jgi:hypothetical protein
MDESLEILWWRLLCLETVAGHAETQGPLVSNMANLQRKLDSIYQVGPYLENACKYTSNTENISDLQ